MGRESKIKSKIWNVYCLIHNYNLINYWIKNRYDRLIKNYAYFRGADNRGDDTLEEMMSTPPSEDDDSSDSDVPLSTYIRKGKTKKGQ